MAAPLRLSRCALDRAHNTSMGAAAAQIVGERVFDVALARLPVLGQERRRLHDHAVNAVSALRSLLVDEGFLHRMRPLGRAEAFQRYHLRLGIQRGQRRHTRTNGLAIDVDRASAALTEPTTKSWAA